MPRPGPRPYECVRRAWHSDRHQPMRGSLIQEIFREANELHSAATRKNKEWQEKLPFVVFKAEEIMYSKANSEAEYMDLATLWDRANDAIDTIIRKDDSALDAEGDLLQPCIEAALNLGCIPRRASRSQRHTNPGCYLSSTAKYNSPISLKIPDGSQVLPGMASSAPPFLSSSSPDSANLATSASWCSAVLKQPAAADSGAPPCSRSVFNASCEPTSSRVAVSHESLPLSSNPPAIPVDACSSPDFGRIYPLCYFGNKENSCFRLPLRTPPGRKQQNTGLVGQTLDGKSATSSSNNVPIDVETFALGDGCDLSLRLGLPSPAWSGVENSWADEVEDVGSSSSCDDGGKFYDAAPCRARAVNIERPFAPAEDKCFDFF